MKKSNAQIKGFRKAGVLLLCLLFGSAAAAEGRSFPSDRSGGGTAAPKREAPATTGEFLDSSLSVTVTDPDGNPVKGFRWLLEEDTTFYNRPGQTDPAPLTVRFHSSYAPVVAKGNQARQATTMVPINSAKRYFLSILPSNGNYTLSGTPIMPGQTEATVVVQHLPLPTAQITVFVFEDLSPINQVPDLPAETGLAGFSVYLEDAGGRYGASAGMQSQDAFGKSLGTTYQRNPDGSYVLVDGAPVVDTIGQGFLVTDAEGKANFRNLAPGKYGIITIPPTGEGWQQTTTIEGTRLIDAWVKSDEPPFLIEVGPTLPHIFMGFLRPFNNISLAEGTGTTVSGQIVNNHFGSPQNPEGGPGAPLSHTTPWIALNIGPVNAGTGVYAGPALDGDGNFTIPDLPPGTYELVVFDENLVIIIGFFTLIVDGGGTCNTGNSCDLGTVAVNHWFNRLENWVFADANGDGFMDPGEEGIPEQAVILRWRDGTVYQALPTDLEGFSPFDQIFPFFNWLVAEVDFARFKATGATFVVDAGGNIEQFKTDNPGLTEWTFGDQLVPQDQDPGTAGVQPYRTETGVVLTQGYQGMAGQTSVIMWGKKAYDPGENGGISGIVYYATTRAEDDPALAGAEPWEPGIPGVTVRLYDSTGLTLLNETTTDSWDDDLPTGCLPFPTFTIGSMDFGCFDGLQNWNQLRPAVFDGGYAFETAWSPSFGAPGAVESALGPGVYLVEVILPPGYEILKEEDRNVDFGEVYVPSEMLLPPECVGPDHLVPMSFSLFPLFEDDGSVARPYRAGEMAALCTKKRVTLNNGANAAADFFLFTEVPIAAHATGLVNLDTHNEVNPLSPNFNEKFGPEWIPVSFRDVSGTEVARTYTDEFGSYNVLLPSTFTNNLPQPSGMSPNMLTQCINDRFRPDGSVDPYYNTGYATLCYTWQFMPGTTTYLDTPTVPVAAFAATHNNPVDCELPDGSPVISSATVPANGVGGGPYIFSPLGQTLTLTSMGDTVAVPNPAYCPGPPTSDCSPVDTARTVDRDLGFGAPRGTGFVEIIDSTGFVYAPASYTGWDADTISVTLPPLPDGIYQISVTRDGGEESMAGVSLQVGLRAGGAVRVVTPGPFPATPIQDAIDNAGPNDLVLVSPGTYDEMPIMWKPVQLQGWGAGAVTIDGIKDPKAKVSFWRERLTDLVDNGDVDLLPGQELSFDYNTGVGGSFFAEDGAGIFVITKATGANSFATVPGARIDGFTVTNADIGGGIVVNNNADMLTISNNIVRNNAGFLSGGIRLGHPNLTSDDGGPVVYTDAGNNDITLFQNRVLLNGAAPESAASSGAGISVNKGSDSYLIASNFVCGNFNLHSGAGIGHLGLSTDDDIADVPGRIIDNYIVFNESFNPGATVSGGGIYVSGASPVGPQTITEGTGDVVIARNVIRGNSAGSGDGAGIGLFQVNGEDVAGSPGDDGDWHHIFVYNNMITNNMAGAAGGGVAVQDALRVTFLNNTVAHNDSTATSQGTFPPEDRNTSLNQPAGLAVRSNTPALQALIDGATVPPLSSEPDFSDVMPLQNNIFWQNRSFYFTVVGGARLVPDVASPPMTFWDIGVLNSGCLNPSNTVITSLTPALDPSGCDYTGFANTTGDPDFLMPYFNGNRTASVIDPFTPTDLQVPIAIDEGGNWVNVVFGPLTFVGDYHLAASGSSAHSAGFDVSGGFSDIDPDIDEDVRPDGIMDIGADEIPDPPPFRRERSSPSGSSDRVLGEKGGIQWLRLQ